jgi:hypothetical protein
MSDSRELIRAIMDEDFVTAKEITNGLLFSTVADHIDDVKAEVGMNLFDCDEVSEGYMSANRYGGGKKFDFSKPHPSNKDSNKDYDKDGKIESPKNEVFGSRINAAVKSGKLSPERAAKTKNKGKYR